MSRVPAHLSALKAVSKVRRRKRNKDGCSSNTTTTPTGWKIYALCLLWRISIKRFSTLITSSFFLLIFRFLDTNLPDDQGTVVAVVAITTATTSKTTACCCLLVAN